MCCVANNVKLRLQIFTVHEIADVETRDIFGDKILASTQASVTFVEITAGGLLKG